jgi:energy-converting hydrogenase Eha subunit A
MPDFLKAPFVNGTQIEPFDVLVRLVVALVLGGVVAWIYRRTRKSTEISASFPITLVLLAVLIAMVTQVIGDNVARAFSLVGALSIVRFRTVVRDTQDTAYVIFAVVVGMAVGASDLWVSLIGIGVVGLAAFVMMTRPGLISGSQPSFLLSLRVGLGHDLDKLLNGTLDAHLQGRELMSIATARQGVSLDVTYETRLRPDGSADELVKALNRVEGVQSVQLQRRGFDEV